MKKIAVCLAICVAVLAFVGGPASAGPPPKGPTTTVYTPTMCLDESGVEYDCSPVATTAAPPVPIAAPAFEIAPVAESFQVISGVLLGALISVCLIGFGITIAARVIRVVTRRLA